MVRRGTLVAVVVTALAAALAVAAGGALLRRDPSRGVRALAVEAIDDHLRVLATSHPLAVETGDPHALKPWLSGQLHFSPLVPTAPGSELALRGAAVGYVFDHKAAVLVYRLRLHLVTLLAFRAEGLPWPAGGLRDGPAPRLAALSERGFHAVLWRASGLGYALVSDSNPVELDGYARVLAAGTDGATGATAAGAAP
jgi:anti-sigma factor RsiW